MRVFLLLALVSSLPAAGLAAPSGVRVSFIGDPSTKMGVAWNLPVGASPGLLEVGTSSGNYTQLAQPKLSSWSSTQSVAEAVLENLLPDTQYYYRVGDPQGGYSPEQSFRTAPAPHPSCARFRFAVAGDSRAESWEGDKGVSSIWPVLATRAAAHLAAFIIHSGDIVYDGENQKQWQNHLQASAPVSALIPILYVLGNHDDGPGQGDSANFNQLFQMPRADKALGGSGTEDYYFFRFGNAIFVALSTETFTGGATPMKSQADWMDKVLTQNPARWRFVVIHRPIYTQSLPLIGHPPNEIGQNAALVPIINKHHVDIVFGGHNHFYERFVPSACSDSASSSPCPVSSFEKGTVYITTGGGGAFPIIFPGGTNSVRLVASAKHHYLLLDIDNDRLELQARDDSDALIDSLSIQKPALAPDPCASPGLDAPRPNGDGPRPDGPRDMAISLPDLAPARPETAAPASLEPTQPRAGGCACSTGPAGPAGTLGWLGLLLLLRLPRRAARRCEAKHR